ncbi:hypothetical protein [Shimia sp.]|uniref:hypothetical protein n=1 Tax=Shimia sp. TaxID=1954381 RepID=UPI003297F867
MCPDLALCEITSSEGAPLGWVLGHAVDAEGILLSDRTKLPISQSDPKIADKVEDWVKWLSGRYVVLLDLPGETRAQRAYHDPLGSYGLVYDPQSRTLASSLLLCLDRDIVPSTNYRLQDSVLNDAQLSALLPEFDPTLPPGGFGFGETPDAHVRRLLANRYIDLTDFSEHRFWPGNDDFSPLSMPEAAEIIVHRMRQLMIAFCKDLSGYFAISGGRDSRMLLAACPDLSQSGIQLYSYANNYMTTLDLRVAEEMARLVGRPILTQIPESGCRGSFLPHKRRAAPLRHRFAVSSGLMHTGDEWWQRGFARKLKPGGVWIRGNFLEIATARSWPRRNQSLRNEMGHALENLRIGLGDDADRARKMAQLKEWSTSFDYDFERHFHDYTYMDLTTAPPQANFHGYNQQFYVAPASDRQIFRASMQVPGKLRQNTSFYDEIMRQLNATMHAIPLAKPTAYHSRRIGANATELLEDKINAYRTAMNV